MNLKALTDDTLIYETEKLAKTEREILSQILLHLREIERRRLFAKLKFSSLFEYTVKRLGYSEDQAYRRVQAMRLLKELPEIEEQINAGRLNLTHIGLAQSFLKKEEKTFQREFSKNQKLEILKALENKSKREAEKFVTSLSSQTEPVFHEIKKVISPTLTEVRVALPDDTMAKIEKLKGLVAHKHPNISLAELIDELCELGLKNWSPTSPALARAAAHNNQSKNETKIAPKSSQIKTRALIWQKASGRCQNCGSIYALEIDHHLPKALGGDSTPDNLRLLCRSCNQRAAIVAFGVRKVEQYLQ